MANLQNQFCPLGDEACALLNQTLQSCSDLSCYLEKLAAVGLDVSDWQARNASQQALAAGLKQVHFPGQP